MVLTRFYVANYNGFANVKKCHSWGKFNEKCLWEEKRWHVMPHWPQLYLSQTLLALNFAIFFWFCYIYFFPPFATFSISKDAYCLYQPRKLRKELHASTVLFNDIYRQSQHFERCCLKLNLSLSILYVVRMTSRLSLNIYISKYIYPICSFAIFAISNMWLIYFIILKTRNERLIKFIFIWMQYILRYPRIYMTDEGYHNYKILKQCSSLSRNE